MGIINERHAPHARFGYARKKKYFEYVKRMGGREGQPSHGKVVRPRKKRIEGEGKGYIIYSESSQPPPSFLRAEEIVYGVCGGGECGYFNSALLGVTVKNCGMPHHRQERERESLFEN